MVVEGRAQRGDADALALEVGDPAQAAVVQLPLDHDARERVARPLAPLVGHDPHLLAAEHDVVEGRRDAGGAHVDLPRGERRGDGRGGLEEDQLGLDAELLEEALVDADEERRRRGELERADLDLLLGVRGRGAAPSTATAQAARASAVIRRIEKPPLVTVQS